MLPEYAEHETSVAVPTARPTPSLPKKAAGGARVAAQVEVDVGAELIRAGQAILGAEWVAVGGAEVVDYIVERSCRQHEQSKGEEGGGRREHEKWRGIISWTMSLAA